MRLSDDEFPDLLMMDEFLNYYESLSVDEITEEFSRLLNPTTGGAFRVMNQYAALYRRCVHIACFDESLDDLRRSAFIVACGDLREFLTKTILPRVKPEIVENMVRALAGTDNYISKCGSYPRAVELVIVGARNPTGPYPLGVIGEVLSRAPTSDPDFLLPVLDEEQ